MKRYLILSLFATGMLLLNACRNKNLPEPQVGEPVFCFEGNVNGISEKIEAGVNEYYQFTNYQIYSDSSGLLMLSGDLKKENTNQADKSLSIKFFDTQARTSLSNVDLELLLNRQQIPFYTRFKPANTNRVVYYFNATPIPPALGIEYEWSFGDGDSAKGPNVFHHYTSNGAFNVCLRISKGGIIIDQLCNTVNAGPNGSNCNSTFNYIKTGATSFQLNAQQGGQSYNWLAGNQTLSGASVQYNHPGSNMDTLLISLTSSFQNCQSSFTRKISMNSNTIFADFTYRQINETIENQIVEALEGKIIIEWTTSSGTVYHTVKNYSNFPINNSIKLKNVKPYLKNKQNQSTYYFETDVECYLYEKNNPKDSIYFKSKQLKFAVAFPEK
jgi:hypothetical protein